MIERRDEFLPTRESLLERLRSWDDQESWRQFFNMYWGLLYRTALRAGLGEEESQDVVQDTIIMIAKKMESFKYDPEVDSFKGWMLYLVRKRIALEYRRRARGQARLQASAEQLAAEIAELPDPGAMEWQSSWEQEWALTMWNEALKKVKEQTPLKQFQMFNLYVVKERPAVEVARALNVPVAQVYLAKHRVSALMKKELNRLRTSLG